MGILNIGSHAVVGGEAEWHRAQILRRIGGDDNVELDRETVRKPGRLLELVGRETLQRQPAPGEAVDAEDRKSTRLNSITNAHLVCRLLLEKKKHRYY